jgi:DNA-binding protein H-NS
MDNISEARLEELLNKRDITDEERKERDALITRQITEAKNKLKG